ncbi:MAG: TIGR00282 family metallophosphoesterase [Chthonomonadales bacterium]
MRILFVGDVVGKPGRDAVEKLLPGIRSQTRADFVIVNGENSAGGLGITRDIAMSMYGKSKVDVITLGNHAWSIRDSHTFLDEEPRILRPSNYPPGVPGRGLGIFQRPEGAVCVISLQCRVFMEHCDDPFRAIDDLLESVPTTCKIIFVDLHGEATSEKQAFGWYVDGRVSAVVGTHTHVQTADERILTKGTAFLTDAGMTGPINSIIGMDREVATSRFLTGLSSRFEVAAGPAKLCGVVIEVDAQTGKALSIERVSGTTGGVEPVDEDEEEDFMSQVNT